MRPEWAKRSKEIKFRNDFTCQKCKIKKPVLQVHHKYYVIGRLPWEYPDCGLITLCNSCHASEHQSTTIPKYNSKSLDLLKIENPEQYYIECEKRESEKKRKEYEQVKNDKFEQERKESQKYTLIGIVLSPIVLLVSSLLFLGKGAALMLGSFIVGGLTFYFLDIFGVTFWIAFIISFIAFFISLVKLENIVK